VASRPKITGRATSIAGAFVHAIIPRTVDLRAQEELFRRAGINPSECVYCGAAATDQDHLRALVKGGRPSGHYHTTDNLVPSCGRCNQSKGGSEWRAWIRGTAKGSPARRGINDIEERVARLEVFEREAALVLSSHAIDLRQAAGPARWDSYWQRLDDIKVLMVDAQKEADQIVVLLEAARPK